MKAAIYGAGSLGTVLGAYIAKAGYQIDLINRNAAHVAALKESGAHIVGKVEMTVPVRALLTEEMTETYDLIFLMTKQLDNEAVVRSLLPHLEKEGAIVTMQNGMPELSVSEVVGEARTYGCTVGWGATRSGRASASSLPNRTASPLPSAVRTGIGTINSTMRSNCSALWERWRSRKTFWARAGPNC